MEMSMEMRDFGMEKKKLLLVSFAEFEEVKKTPGSLPSG